MKKWTGIPWGAGLVEGRLEPAGEPRARSGDGVELILLYSAFPTVCEYIQRVRSAGIAGVVFAQCSPYSHLAWAISYVGVPAVFVSLPDDLGADTVVYLDADEGNILYPESDEERESLEKDRLNRLAKRDRIAANATRPARSRSGKSIRVLAQIQCADDVAIAVASGADGIGEVKSELTCVPVGLGQTIVEIVDRIRLETNWTEIPIRFFDFEGEKANAPSVDHGPMGIRGVRYSEKETTSVECFLALMDGIDLEGVVVILPMVTLPSEVERFRARLSKRCSRLGVLVETPAAAITVREFRSVADYFIIGINDLTQYTMAWDRRIPNAELLPAQRMATPVAQLVSWIVQSLEDRLDAVALAIDLPPNCVLAEQVIAAGIQTITVPPRCIPKWKELIRESDQ